MKKLSNPIFFTELSKRSPVLLSPLKSTCWLANREVLANLIGLKRSKMLRQEKQGAVTWYLNRISL